MVKIGEIKNFERLFEKSMSVTSKKALSRNKEKKRFKKRDRVCTPVMRSSFTNRSNNKVISFSENFYCQTKMCQKMFPIFCLQSLIKSDLITKERRKMLAYLIVQLKPLNVITLGQTKRDHIN